MKTFAAVLIALSVLVIARRGAFGTDTTRIDSPYVVSFSAATPISPQALVSPPICPSLPCNQLTVHGIDVYAGNSETCPIGQPCCFENVHHIDWGQVSAAGINFAFIKATEGSATDGYYFDDCFFTENIRGATAAGILAGAYHFARPQYPVVADATAEAQHFLDIAGPYLQNPYLAPALDVEVGADGSTTGCPLTPSDLSQWINTWAQTVRAAKNVTPVIYTYRSYAETCFGGSLDGYPLWIADTNYPGQPCLTCPQTGEGYGGWSHWEFLQYDTSNTSYVQGVFKPVDRNLFNGSMAELITSFQIGASTATNPPSASRTPTRTQTAPSSSTSTPTPTRTPTRTPTAPDIVGISVQPNDTWEIVGYPGGPFGNSNRTYTIYKTGDPSANLSFSFDANSWLSPSSGSGTFNTGTESSFQFSLNSAPNSFPSGVYTTSITFTNNTNHVGDTTRTVRLTIRDPADVCVVDEYPSAENWIKVGNRLVFRTNLGGNLANYELFDLATKTVIRSITSVYGSAFDADATYLVVGDAFDDTGATDAGAVYLYDWATGSQIQKILNPTPIGKDNFGGDRVLLRNDRLFVTAHNFIGDHSAGDKAGKVHVFTVPSGSLVGTIQNPQPTFASYLGNVMDGTGESLFVGTTPGTGGTGVVYQFNATTLAYVRTLSNPNPEVGAGSTDNFGGVVYTGDNWLIVSASGEDLGCVDCGVLYAYNATTGALVHTFQNPILDNSAGFAGAGGFAVSGDILLVGASNYNASPLLLGSGAAFAFNLATGGYMGPLFDPVPAFDVRFGSYVALYNGHFLVGRNDKIYELDFGVCDLPTPTATPTKSPSPTISPTATLSATPTPTVTATSSPTITATSAPSPSPLPPGTCCEYPALRACGAVEGGQCGVGGVPVLNAVCGTNGSCSVVPPTATATPIDCVGDCDGTGAVTVNERITMVNIALGNADPSACVHGVPTGGTVDVSLIVRAVNNALSSCPTS